MRLIEDDVMDLIAGGDSVVYVSGTRDFDWPPPYDPWNPYGDNGGGYGDTGGGGGGDPQPDPCTHSSPAPASGAPNVNLEALRDSVQAIANQILTMDPGKEHGAYFIRTSDGGMRVTSIWTGGDSSFRSSYGLYPGESLVAWVHSHPNNGADNRFPSTSFNAEHPESADTLAADFLLSTPNTDPNALMYIIDVRSRDTFEYTAKGGDTLRPLGADITKDQAAGC
jgi:hypothetical protein